MQVAEAERGDQARGNLRRGADGWRVWGLLAAIWALGVLTFWNTARGSDLMALWAAGHFMAQGRPDLVYPPDMGVFLMYPPDAWLGWLREAHGYADAVFPFIYPPLWAWLAGLLPEVPFQTWIHASIVINMTLIVGMIWLVVDTLRPQRPELAALLAGLVLMATLLGSLAVFEGQPHVFVSFLLILAWRALVRERDGWVGGALALAASIKLFPALLAVMLVTGRRWRALGWFAGVGAGLAALSVAVAGWPMHAAFLRLIGQISATPLVTGATLSLTSFLAKTFGVFDVQFVPGINPDFHGPTMGGWWLLREARGWSLGLNLATAGVLALLGLAWRRTGPPAAKGAIWALALIALNLLAPIAWFFYMIPVAALLPVLPERLGWPLGGTLAGLGALGFAGPAPALAGALLGQEVEFVQTMFMGALIWTLGFAWAAWWPRG